MLIGEVARRSGVSVRMLRHYDALGLVRPTGRTTAGYREYSTEDVHRVFHVESLRSLGMSLRQVGRALADPGFEPAALVDDLVRRTGERVAREQELLDRLRAVAASAPAEWPDVLHLVALLRALESPDAARRQQAVLARAQDVPVAPELLAGALLAESDPNVAGALRWALARTGGDAVASLVAGLDCPDVDVRRRAVEALAGIPGDEAVGALTGALGDPNPSVRRPAALASGGRGVGAAVPTLVGMVVEGANDVEAAEVLGQLARDDAHAHRVREALVDERADPGATPAARLRLIQAVVETPFAGAVLQGLAGDADPTVARVAAALHAVLDERCRRGG